MIWLWLALLAFALLIALVTPDGLLVLAVGLGSFSTALTLSVSALGSQGSIYPIDFCALVVLVALIVRKARRSDSFSTGGRWIIGAFGIWIVVELSIGLLHYPLSSVASDARGPALVVLGVFLGRAGKMDSSLARKLCAMSSSVLWLTTILIILDVATGLSVLVSDTTSVATQANGFTETFHASRFSTPLTALAVGVLVVSLVRLISGDLRGRERRRLVVAHLAPALTLTFFSFERNALLATVVGLLVGLALSLRRGGAGGLVARLGGVLTASFLVVLALAILGGGVVADEFDAYAGRTISTLSPTAVENDPSVQFRIYETDAAFEYIQAHPLVGGGLGASYRTQLVDDPFPSAAGTRYVHDFYLWTAVKGGVIGALLFFMLAWSPVAEGFLRPGKRSVEELAILAGIMAMDTVAVASPFPLGLGSALAFGAALGYVWTEAGTRERDVAVPSRVSARGSQREVPWTRGPGPWIAGRGR